MEFHGHNDFGLATANTIAAYRYGCKRANVAFADGECFFMTDDITEKELRALLTIAGGEDVTRDDLIERGILK